MPAAWFILMLARSDLLGLVARSSPQGCVGASHGAGLDGRNGYGVRPNDHVALKWFRNAADGGNAVAQLQTSVMYYEGQSVPQNFAEAARGISLLPIAATLRPSTTLEFCTCREPRRSDGGRVAYAESFAAG